MELPLYFFRKGQVAFGFKVLFGEFFSLFLFAFAIYRNTAAGIVVFGIPWVLMRFFMMAANWGQHAFISKDEHSLTILDSSYNILAFNDGFHASHHDNSLRHWSDHSTMPGSSHELTTITLSGDINFGDVWLLLMTKNYSELERRVVFSDKTNRPSKDFIIAELKRQVARRDYKELRK